MMAEPAEPEAGAAVGTLPAKRGRALWVTGVLLLLVLIGVVAQFGNGTEYLRLLRDARPEWLLVALGLQFGTYLLAAGSWQRALACQGKHDSLWHLVKLGVAKTFMDQAVPLAGLSGSLLVARGLRRHGVPNRDAIVTVLAGLVAFYLSYAVAVGAALALLWSTGRVSRLVTSAATLFAVIVTAFPVTIVWLTSRSRTHFPRWTQRIGGLRHLLAALGERPSRIMRNVPFLVQATALQLGIVICDALTLAALIYAVGWQSSLRAAFVSFTIASMVGTVSLIPGGLGTFDGTAIAMLGAFGVPLEPALASVVLLRGFTFVLPLAPGFWVARDESRWKEEVQQAEGS